MKKKTKAAQYGGWEIVGIILLWIALIMISIKFAP